jgi:hypothetical protein
MVKMEWFATQWIIMQPASSSDEGVMVWGLKIFDQFLGRVHRRYWREIIQFNASKFGDEFSDSVGNPAVLGIISQLNATTPCPIGAIPEVLSPW